MKSIVIFVVGNSRSGTTMMARILENHSDVFRFLELHFFEELWSLDDKGRLLSNKAAVNLAARLLASQRDDYMFRTDIEPYVHEAANVVGEIHESELTLEKVYNEFLFYETNANHRKIPCENTPRNVYYINEILELFPDARIINMVRDPRDVLLSQKRKWKRWYLRKEGFPVKETVRVLSNYHPITISKLWNSSVGAAAKFSDNKRVLSLRYEDLIAAPSKIVKEVCAFIGLSFDDELLEVPQGGSSSVKDTNDKKGVRKDRVGGWQKGGLNSAEVFICQAITKDLMKNNGYKPVDIFPNPLGLVYYFVSFPIKIALALLLNLKRMRNIIGTIKRRLF